MGLGNMDLLDDGDGDGGKETLMAVLCSICLDAVRDEGDRSWAKLQCGHQFHLDCIGSAFNVKGAMQCPNCRKIEKGQWLYANGSRPLPEFSMDEWAHDEDLYDISYSEMSFGVHWCPFSGSMTTRLPSTFDEGEYSSSSYHDLIGHHAVFAEHTPVSSTSHPCPYVAYIGPIHPSSSTSSGSISDGSSFNNHWNGTSEIPGSYVFPSMDVPPYHHNWDHSSFARVGGAEQPSIPSVTQRTSRNGSDMPRPGMHPYVFGHSTVGRAPSSVTSQMVPPYPGTVARPRDRIPSLQSYLQQSNSNPTPTRAPVIPNSRRSSNHRGLPQVAPISSSLSSDQSNGFYLFSSSSSSGRNYQEVENHHHVWEREHQQQPPFPLSQVYRDSSIWGPFHLPGGGSDNLMRSNNNNYNRQRYGGSERMPSHQQNRS